MKVLRPSKILSIVLGSVIGGALIAVIIGVAVMIVTTPMKNSSLADRLPVNQTALFARTKDAATLETVLERAQSLWNLPMETIPPIEGEGSFEFALLTNSGGTMEWILSHHSGTGGVLLTFSDDAVQATLSENHAMTLDELSVWENASSEAGNIVLIATASVPEQSETLSKVLSSLLTTSPHIALVWNEGGKGSILFETKTRNAVPTGTLLSSEKALFSGFFALPEETLAMAESALRSVDPALADGIKGILLQKIRSLAGTPDADKDFALLLSSPLSLMIESGSGDTIETLMQASIQDDKTRMKIEEKLTQEISDDGIIRTIELPKGQIRREVTAEKSGSGSRAGDIVLALSNGGTLSLSLRDDDFSIFTNAQEVPRKMKIIDSLSRGSADLLWFRTQRDALFPFLTIPQTFPWNFFEDAQALQWNLAYEGGVIKLEWEKS